ncbi:MAG: HlyD family efflux transporter periplasmic adaptor subunit [Planctomycetaceae bacterium]
MNQPMSLKIKNLMKAISNRLPWIILVAILAGLVTYGFWPVPVKVEVATVKKGSLQVTIQDDGITRIREKYIVSAPVSGKLLRVMLKEGDPVEQASSVLAHIEPGDPALLDARALAEVKARVQAAKASEKRAGASLERAKEAHKLSKLQYDRAVKLKKEDAITEDEYDRAENQFRLTAADVRSAEFALAVAKFEWELAKAALVRSRPSESNPDAPTLLTIISPVTGRVLRIFEKNAGAVTVGTKLLEVGNPQDLEMKIDVLSTDAVKIHPGARVYVEHWGGDHRLEGVVRVVEPAAFLKVSALGVEEQRVNVIANFTSPLKARETLGDGYRIEAKIVVRELKDVVKVASGALFREGDNWFVFKVVEHRAVQQRVQLGATNGVETEVLSGLSADDVVILHPTDKVKEGVSVQFD